jgi:Transmembrane amino acid transporter protein
MSMVNLMTVVTLLGCYLPLGVAGYVLYSGSHIPSNMLTKLSETSLAVLIARIVMGCLLFGTYSLFIIPLRRKLEMKLYSRLSVETTDSRRLSVAAVLMLAVLGSSIELRDLGLANAIAGGCLGLVILSFPGAMILHGERGPGASVALTAGDANRRSKRVILGYGFIGCGIVIAFFGLFGAALLGY